MEIYDRYLQGVAELLQTLGPDHPDYLKVLTYQGRLAEAIGEMREHGSTESMRVEISKVTSALDRLCQENLGCSFRALAGVGVPAEAGPPPILHNLPHRDYGQFVGRSEEMVQLQQLLSTESRSWVVAIHGIGGIGKTALALETAHRYLEERESTPAGRQFDAIIWTSAKTSVLTADGERERPQAMRTLEDIYAAIAVTLEREEITRARPEQQSEVVKRALTRQRALLILDNFDTVGDERVNAFLRDLPPPTKAVVTTRFKIDLAYPIHLTGMPEPNGLELIARECNKKGVDLTPAQAQRLFERTGGIPLAIVWSVAQMGLGHRAESILDLLGKPRGELAHFLFDEAMKRVEDTSAQPILRALALFATDAGRETLGYVAGLEQQELDRDEGLVLLERASLVIRHRLTDRFSLLPLTKRFVTQQLAQEPSFVKHARRRQVARFLRLGDQRTLYHPFQEEQIRAMRLNLANILDALEWCEEAQEWGLMIDLTTTVQDFLGISGFWNERVEWGLKSVEGAQKLGDKQALAFLYVDTLGWLAMTRGEREKAERWVREGLSYAEEVGDRAVQCIGARYLYRLMHAAGHGRQADEYLARAQALAAELDSPGLMAGVAIDRAYFELGRGNYEEAEKWVLESREGFERMGDVLRGARKVADLAWVYVEHGRPEEAKRLVAEAIPVFEQLKLQEGLAHAYYCRGRAEARSGEYEAAAVSLGAAWDIYQQLGNSDRAQQVAQELDVCQKALAEEEEGSDVGA